MHQGAEDPRLRLLFVPPCRSSWGSSLAATMKRGICDSCQSLKRAFRKKAARKCHQWGTGTAYSMCPCRRLWTYRVHIGRHAAFSLHCSCHLGLAAAYLINTTAGVHMSHRLIAGSQRNSWLLGKGHLGRKPNTRRGECIESCWGVLKAHRCNLGSWCTAGLGNDALGALRVLGMMLYGKMLTLLDLVHITPRYL
jgi:hypothetical protein